MKIPVEGIVLEGNLIVPPDARGIVVFAHGSGSSRFSPRNNFVAEKLQSKGLATLLMDLLTQKEERVDIRTREFRFNIPLLSRRLVGVAKWIQNNENTKSFKIGYFGSSTGAAAALIAASIEPKNIGAVVSRGGRTDLAKDYLSNIEAPTLLIVGSNDVVVLNLNRETLKHLKTEKKIEVIPGASHLFEEPGTLEAVAELAGDWFKEHLE